MGSYLEGLMVTFYIVVKDFRKQVTNRGDCQFSFCFLTFYCIIKYPCIIIFVLSLVCDEVRQTMNVMMELKTENQVRKATTDKSRNINSNLEFTFWQAPACFSTVQYSTLNRTCEEVSVCVCMYIKVWESRFSCTLNPRNEI